MPAAVREGGGAGAADSGSENDDICSDPTAFVEDMVALSGVATRAQWVAEAIAREAVVRGTRDNVAVLFSYL